MQKNYLKKLCLSAVMAALYFGLDFFSSYLSKLTGDTFKISFSALPVMIIAVICGPVWAMGTGLVGAFLGQLIGPYGLTATTLLWCMPAVVRAVSFGLLFILLKRSLKPSALSVSAVISSILVTATNSLVMYLDALIYKYPIEIFEVTVIYRIIIGIISAVVFAFILPPIINAISKALEK